MAPSLPLPDTNAVQWLHAGAKQYGANDVSYDEAVHAVYGMPVKVKPTVQCTTAAV